MTPIYGFYTLFKKETLRFWKVGAQTVFAPIITALLYQLIFSHIMQGRTEVLPGVGYSAFLIPGLAMMSMQQNAFANASSSLIQSRITGNLVFILLSPLSVFSFFSAYVCAAILRGLMVGVGVVLATAWFGLPVPAHPLWILFFAIGATWMMGVLGLLAGIVAEKFDQLAMFQNFLIMPLTFLSGVFYSIHSLPQFWQKISQFNPMFYMIDGFRYGFFGVSDVSVLRSATVVGIFCLLLSATILRLLQTGYKLRQ